MRISFRQGYLFEHEITDEIAPKYHQFIRRPIALDTIRKNLESNVYSNKDFFKRDIYLMLYNAMKYNPRFHHVHRSAKVVFNSAQPLFQVNRCDRTIDVLLFLRLASRAGNSSTDRCESERLVRGDDVE